jgi:hypothetical protein
MVIDRVVRVIVPPGSVENIDKIIYRIKLEILIIIVGFSWNDINFIYIRIIIQNKSRINPELIQNKYRINPE